MKGRKGLVQGKLTAERRKAAFLGWMVLLWLQIWGRDVIMPWLIQTWQAPITPPLETERAGGGGGGTELRKKREEAV